MLQEADFTALGNLKSELQDTIYVAVLFKPFNSGYFLGKSKIFVRKQPQSCEMHHLLWNSLPLFC